MSDFFKQSPVVAAIKNHADSSLLDSLDIRVVFLLSGNISDLDGYTKKLQDGGKQVFIHIDLINGLRADKEGLRFVAEKIKPDGIISTKTMNVRYAHDLGLKTVFRVFMVDTIAYDTGFTGIHACKPDYVEVMPGLVFDVIRQLKNDTTIPIIAGGMIKTADQARQAFENGATAISTSNQKLWKAAQSIRR